MHQRLGLGAPVGLDVAGDDIDAGGALLVGGLEHGVGFADAGRGAEEDFQLALGRASLFGLHPRQERIGIGTIIHKC